MDKNLEKIMLAYGTFHTEMAMAFTFNANSHVRSAKKALERIYELMPEPTFKESFPETYKVIQDARDRWNNFYPTTPSGD